jgi:hypothetical protein
MLLMLYDCMTLQIQGVLKKHAIKNDVFVVKLKSERSIKIPKKKERKNQQAIIKIKNTLLPILCGCTYLLCGL